MKIYYYCGILKQERVLHASKHFAKDRAFFWGYLERLGAGLHLIELDEGETWATP